jgi:hypothetical protein
MSYTSNLTALGTGLAPIHPEQDRINFSPKLAGDVRVLLPDNGQALKYLTLNHVYRIDDVSNPSIHIPELENTVWVVSDIEGWWNIPEPSIPNIERGFGDGSFDITGRNLARNITINGSVLITESTRTSISSASASVRQQLLNTFNLVRRGTWLVVDEDDYKRACFIRLSGQPNISTINSRGRIDFSIGLKAADPVKYEWIDITSSNLPSGQAPVANGYNVKVIGEFGFRNSSTEMYDKYGNTDYNTATTENFREYDGYGKVDRTANTYEEYRDYNLTTSQTGVSGSTTVVNYGTANVYCYFRVIGPLYGPAEINNTSTGQTISILGKTSEPYQVLGPTEANPTVIEYLDIDTRSREVHKGNFTTGQQVGSSRGLLDPVVDWIYLAPGNNSISFTDFGTDTVTSAPQLQIYWRSGWSG